MITASYYSSKIGLHLIAGTNSTNFIIKFIGVAIIGISLTLLYFMVKFFFTKPVKNESLELEIQESDEPKLFQLINEVSQSTQVQPPKKVYLTNELNASVRFNSIFWALFGLSRKNLVIGTPLISSLSELEFKAVLAHEFGHFSQRSLQIGIYIYFIQIRIHEMLYNNKLLHDLAAPKTQSNVFTVLFYFTGQLMIGIQHILLYAYHVVNLAYMALSKEMEHHADEVAASITGYRPLESALNRMPFTESVINATFTIIGQQYEKGNKSSNIMANIQYMNGQSIKAACLKTANGLPKISFDDLTKYTFTFIEFDDKYDSHPPTDKRIAHISSYPEYKQPEQNIKASTLFDHLEGYEEKITQMIYDNGQLKTETKIVDESVFTQLTDQYIIDHYFDRIYNDYYNFHDPEKFDLEESLQNKTDSNLTALFDDESVKKIFEIEAYKNDKLTVQNWVTQNVKVETFTYDKVKYKSKDKSKLLNLLIDKVNEANAWAKNHNELIYNYFHKLEVEMNLTGLDAIYNAYFEAKETHSNRLEFIQKCFQKLAFTHETTPFTIIRENFKRFAEYEKELKIIVQEFLDSDKLKEELPSETIELFEKYTQDILTYFHNETYNEENLNILLRVLEASSFCIGEFSYSKKIKLLKYQADLQKQWEAKALVMA